MTWLTCSSAASSKLSCSIRPGSEAGVDHLTVQPSGELRGSCQVTTLLCIASKYINVTSGTAPNCISRRSHWSNYYCIRKSRPPCSQTDRPNSSSIGRFSSATMAIVGMQSAEFGLPAIRGITCMQVNALVEFYAVMM
jgi:hypothetical protein